MELYPLARFLVLFIGHDGGIRQIHSLSIGKSLQAPQSCYATDASTCTLCRLICTFLHLRTMCSSWTATPKYSRRQKPELQCQSVPSPSCIKKSKHADAFLPSTGRSCRGSTARGACQQVAAAAMPVIHNTLSLLLSASASKMATTPSDWMRQLSIVIDVSRQL